MRRGSVQDGSPLINGPWTVGSRQVFGSLELRKASDRVLSHHPVLFSKLEHLREDLKQIVCPMPSSLLRMNVTQARDERLVDRGKGHLMDLSEIAEEPHIVFSCAGR